MSDYQKLILVGRLGRDPEMRYTGAGKPYTKFTLAVNLPKFNEDGDEDTYWYNCTVFGAQAEACNQYLSSGDRVLIEAERFKASAYEGQDGEPRASMDVITRSVQFLNTKGGNGNGHRSPAPAEEAADIPF